MKKLLLLLVLACAASFAQDAKPEPSRPTKRFKMEYPIPDYGDVFTLYEFIDMVSSGCVTNEDGSGLYANPPTMSDVVADPSEVWRGNIPKGYSHVVWFNK